MQQPQQLALPFSKDTRMRLVPHKMHIHPLILVSTSLADGSLCSASDKVPSALVVAVAFLQDLHLLPEPEKRKPGSSTCGLERVPDGVS